MSGRNRGGTGPHHCYSMNDTAVPRFAVVTSGPAGNQAVLTPVRFSRDRHGRFLQVE